MKKTLIYTACVAALFSSSALAQGAGTGQLQGCLVDPNKKVTDIYFANGVGNMEVDAQKSAGHLRKLYKETLDGLGEGRFGTSNFPYAYNPTINKFYDVVEVLHQRSRQAGFSESLAGLQILRLLQGGLNSSEFVSLVKPLLGPARFIPGVDAALRVLYIFASDQIVKAGADAIKNIPEVEAEHTGLYTSSLRAGKRVFVVAHSQGNLFTNASLAAAARAQPDEADSLAMIGVATPDARQFRDSFYRTAHDDRVINLIRSVPGINVAPSNIANIVGTGGFGRSRSNHSFISDYLWPGLPSEEDITFELKRLFINVPFPTQDEGSAIRASLTWGSNPPDFDLHAFEPNGSHVYYKRLSGSGFNGSLDVDDRNGNGPENYVVACDEIELGTYSIGVNYYAGEGPGSVTVNLSLGDGTTRQKSVTFTEAAGREGNIPDPVFTIRVNEHLNPHTNKKIATYKIVE